MVLSKLGAVPAAVRERLPGGSTPDLPGPDPTDIAPDGDAVPEAVPTPDDLPDREELPSTSPRDKLTLGLTVLSVAGALLAVAAAVARAVIKRRRADPDGEVDVSARDDGTGDGTTEPEYPKVAPLVGMAALVGMRLFVERFATDRDE